MRLFAILIAASSLTSFAVGYVTEDIFNSLALYTPLAFTSWAITEWFNDRKIKKQLLEEK
ncbi:hypothetical protein [Staphylococcus equorum]|uniref:hypothetical protein n=1 Tax=Staphylococcus equorum TaxID=246432 RepID=UPI000852B157|nr:hypothetical protein [Staphylococcus equorum]MDK9843176.1 hypothetical protein [Staphylococcus equorum]OEK61328.1 hypothetical protein ASS99_09930 [Staphylococcus equorum]